MRFLGAILLVAFTPVILLAVLLVRITSPGPAFFRQTRLGKDGKPFAVFKIRSMYSDAEDSSGPVLCQPGDSRVTSIGRVLRFLHLDELPQLLNVIRGEMCLVGPRPERPEIIEKHDLRECVPRFDERMKVLPGVTGLAQINLPADQAAESVAPKVELDCEYIATANVFLDMRILMCTALRMLGVRHGRAVRLLGVDRRVSRDDDELFEKSSTYRNSNATSSGSSRASQPAHDVLRSRSAREREASMVSGSRHALNQAEEHVDRDSEVACARNPK